MKVTNIVASSDGRTLTLFFDDTSEITLVGNYEMDRFYGDPVTHVLGCMSIAILSLSERIAKLESPSE